MIIRKQIINFKRGVVSSQEVSNNLGQIYYRYPLIDIFPKDDIKFYSHFPNSWFKNVILHNSSLTLEDLSDYTDIKSAFTLDKFQGVVVDRSYFLPMNHQDWVTDLEKCEIQISLNFLPDEDQDLLCFEYDTIFVILLLMTIQYLKKHNHQFDITISKDKTQSIYRKVISRFTNNKTVTPFDFLTEPSIVDGKDIYTMYAKDEEMKVKIEYFKTVNIPDQFVPQFQKDFPLEDEINKLHIGVNKKVWDLKPIHITTHVQNKNVQIVDITFDNEGKTVTVIMKKHESKQQAEEYLSSIYKSTPPYTTVTKLTNLQYKQIKKKYAILETDVIYTLIAIVC